MTFVSLFCCVFFRLITHLLLSGSWINGWTNHRENPPVVNQIPPNEPRLQPGPGTAIRNTAPAKAQFQAHSSITATTTAPYPVLVIASAPARAHSPAHAQVPALARDTAQSPVQFQVFAPVWMGAREPAVALAQYLKSLQEAPVPAFLLLQGFVTTLSFRVRTKRSRV